MVEECLILQSLARRINHSLELEFTKEELADGVTGGWPGLKEALLHTVIRRLEPERVVETGVAQGVSTTFILDALERTGKGELLSIDLPNYNPLGFQHSDGSGRDPTFVKSRLGTGWLVPDEYRSRWRLALEPSKSGLNKIEGKIDVFFHDSEHSYTTMSEEFNWALGHLRTGGLIISDDISRNSAFKDFCESHPDEIRPILSRTVGLAIKTAE